MYLSQGVGIILVSVLALLTEVAALLDFQYDRSVNSDPITIDKAPFIVQLRHINSTQFCAGTLVSPRFVITAAHCFHTFPVEQYVVVGGVSNRSEEAQIYDIERLFSPSEFDIDTMHRDIAILKLAQEMIGPHMKPIGLCNYTLQEHDSLEIYGWGKTSRQRDSEPSEQLRIATVPVTSYEECKRVYSIHPEQPRELTDTMVCAFVPGTTDACAFDSGGPAIYEGELCAVISGGAECASSTYPGVYTGISAVRAFIEEAMTH